MLALDIGGANLKASDGESRSVSRSFAIWRDPSRLIDELRALVAPWEDWSALAVTMTAELADCFNTKQHGVDHILRVVEELADGREVLVWQTGGEFITPAEARELTLLVAAANWHALATWAARMTPGQAGILIDIGSTTTDIIPLMDGLPDPVGRTDLERLQSGELVYLGVGRTPLCAIAPAAELRGQPTPLAAEFFATTLDLFLLAGDTPENSDNTDTADGRPATRAAAHSRLAHMLCCDASELTLSEAMQVAGQLNDVVRQRVTAAVQRVADRLPSPPSGLLLSGAGEFLARSVIEQIPELTDVETLSLTEMLGPEHSSAACAFALARLATEHTSY